MLIARRSFTVNKRSKPLIQKDNVELRIGLTIVMFNSAKTLQIQSSGMIKGYRRASPLRGLLMRPTRFLVEHRLPLRAKKVINRPIILE
jgi:hypothetical protein